MSHHDAMMQIVSKRIKRIPCFFEWRGPWWISTSRWFRGTGVQPIHTYHKYNRIHVKLYILYTHAYTLKPTDLFFAGLTVGVPFSGSNFQNMGAHFACRNHLNDWITSLPGWFGSNLVDSRSPNDKKARHDAIKKFKAPNLPSGRRVVLVCG